jgi:hypothetical protein
MSGHHVVITFVETGTIFWINIMAKSVITQGVLLRHYFVHNEVIVLLKIEKHGTINWLSGLAS